MSDMALLRMGIRIIYDFSGFRNHDGYNLIIGLNMFEHVFVCQENKIKATRGTPRLQFEISNFSKNYKKTSINKRFKSTL